MSDKKYKTGQIQDNGLMYDSIYDFNKDGKIDLVEDSIRREEIQKSQERWNESHQQSYESKQSSQTPQATGTDGFGCVGILLIIFFCIMGVAMCFGAENDIQKALCIFGGLALALISGWLCGLFDKKDKSDKELGVIESAATKVKQKAESDGKKKTIGKVIGVVMIITAVILLFNIGNIKNAHYYHQAIGFVNEGKYDEAKEALNEISEYKYKEKSELYSFCTALNRFDKGERVSGPNFSYHSYVFDFKFNDAIEQKREKINRQLAQQKEEAERKKAAQSQSATDTSSEEKIPYVGMSESSLYHTSLGTPKVKRNFNRECINGQQYWANKYEYYKSGRIIFTARCVRGKVTQVWDYRNEAESTTAYYGSSKKSSFKSKSVDPYDVNNYSNEEDFYYDHYDDFMDYYEAEDYYNDNHD